MGLSDISAVEQIREESELSVRTTSFSNPGQTTDNTNSIPVCLPSHRHFLRQLGLIAGREQRNTADYAAMNTSLSLTSNHLLYAPCIAEVRASNMEQVPIFILD